MIDWVVIIMLLVVIVLYVAIEFANLVIAVYDELSAWFSKLFKKRTKI